MPERLGRVAVNPKELLDGPERVVEKLIDACQERDFDLVCSLVAPDIEYENVPVGVVHGPEGVRKVLAGGLTAQASEVEWIILDQVTQGSTVMHERIDRFLLRGTWISVRIAARFEVHDGRVTLWRDYFDLEGYLHQRRDIEGQD